MSDSKTTSTTAAAPSALAAVDHSAAAVERHLLHTVGTLPGQASPSEIMHAVAQVAHVVL